MPDFFALEASTPAGKPFPLSTFKDKVVLVVNTATECGFASQFPGLEALHQKYKSQGLAVVGFPCNQFDGQEPVSDADMVTVCQRDHGVTFPLTAKIDVNGAGAHAVYKYLKTQTDGEEIAWNFTKFLIVPDGSVQRYPSETTPESLTGEIEAMLREL